MKTSLVLLFGLAIAFVLFLNPHNLGVSPDSVSYIAVAESILSGDGFRIRGEFVNHWPPFYPLLLALSSKMSGLSVLKSGVFLNGFLIFISGFLYVSILKKLNFKSIILQSFPVLLVLSVPFMVSYWFWSELPFIAILLGVFYCIIAWNFKREKRWLILAGVLSVLLFLTRYAAVGFVSTFCLFVLYYQTGNFVQKIKALISYVIPFVLGVLGWVFYTQTQKAEAVNRDIVFHNFDRWNVLQFFENAFSWFGINVLTTICAIIALVLIALFLYQNKSGLKKFNSIVVLSIAIPVLYVVFLLFSISFLDRMTPLDTRILAPAFPFFLLLIAYVVNWSYLRRSRFQNVLLVTIAISLVGSSFPLWQKHYQEGTCYTGLDAQRYKDFLTREFQYDGETKLYSNSVDLIQFFIGKETEVVDIPFVLNPFSTLKNENYQKEKQILSKELESGTAKVVYFNNYSWKWFYVSKQELLDENSGVKTEFYPEGIIIGD